MDAVIDRLKGLPFFRALKPETLADVAGAACWHSLAGGWPVFEEGTPAEALYVLVSGRLVVVRTGAGEAGLVGYVRTGDPVGEMALLSGGLHSASVYALRDSEMLSIPRAEFNRLLDDHSDLAVALARLSLARAREPAIRFKRAAPRVFAVVGSSPSIDIDAYARLLARAVTAAGKRADYCPVGENAPDSYEFDRREEKCDVMILAARVADTGWYRFVLRHSDRFLVFARRDSRPARPFPLVTEAGERARQFRLVDLVMLEEGARSGAVADWIDALSAARVFHLSDDASLERLGRVVAGRSIGIVLSGGGARAYAHIGAIRALNERGYAIDLACGASMGAVIGACVAMGWSIEETERRIRQAFVETNPLGDFVLPVVALTRGRRVEMRLRDHFGEALIEDMQIPFFCVSPELIEGRINIHRRGRVADALRASVSLPGILPPVAGPGSLLVDGAVINNFPTDIMASQHRGVTLGVDVARRGSITPEAYINPPSFLSWVRRNGVRAAPPIVSLLMRAATARHDDEGARYPADILVTPAVDGVELRDWKKYDAAVEDGYYATLAVLDSLPPGVLTPESLV